jgi:hypothetical protein
VHHPLLLLQMLRCSRMRESMAVCLLCMLLVARRVCRRWSWGVVLLPLWVQWRRQQQQLRVGPSRLG